MLSAHVQGALDYKHITRDHGLSLLKEIVVLEAIERQELREFIQSQYIRYGLDPVIPAAKKANALQELCTVMLNTFNQTTKTPDDAKPTAESIEEFYNKVISAHKAAKDEATSS